MLLVGQQEEHLARKNMSVQVLDCWCGYLSGARCKGLAYGPADATATLSSLQKNPEWLIVPVQAYMGPGLSWKKRPLNNCVCYVGLTIQNKPHCVYRSYSK